MAKPESNFITIRVAQEALDTIRSQFDTEDERLALITPDIYDAVCDVMATAEEPLDVAYGVVWNEEYRQFVLKHLKQNVSMCLISKETNEIKGISILNLVKRTVEMSVISDLKPGPLKDAFSFVDVDYFSKLSVDEYFHISILAVRRKYRRQGVGTRLVQASLALGRGLGLRVFTAEATSEASQSIFEKAGFDTLQVLRYNAFKLPSGKLLSEKMGENECCKIFEKRL